MSISPELQRCIDFHGHFCPGLAIGYRAATIGMDRLNADRSEDEEIIAIVENDTCAVDAVQVLTGCTFGKGNLFFHDYGKMVFTFARRSDGASIRLRLKPDSLEFDDNATEEQRRDLRKAWLLENPPDVIFDIRENVLDTLPRMAKIQESVMCDACGERTMAGKIIHKNGQALCTPCSQK